MEKVGFIEIKITGTRGNLELSPENYDIREIISILENAENLLFPSEKRGRPTLSYKIEDGSVKHILKTSIQHIIGFNAIMGQINQAQNIDFIPEYDEQYLKGLRDKAKSSWLSGINPEIWLKEIRGGYDT